MKENVLFLKGIEKKSRFFFEIVDTWEVVYSHRLHPLLRDLNEFYWCIMTQLGDPLGVSNVFLQKKEKKWWKEFFDFHKGEKNMLEVE